jgi:hypothetical protein
MEIKTQFLEITASIPARALREIVETAIRQAFKDANFWIEQLHVFAAGVEETPAGFAITLHVADIADANGFYSNRLSDDHLKAMLMPALAGMISERARRKCEQEIWMRLIRILNVNRMPRPSQAAQQYRRWLFNLENRPYHVRKQSKLK